MSETGGDDILRHIARGIRSAAVHLRRVLAGEGAAAVGRAAAVGIDDDLAAGETAVTLRAADDEAAGGVDEEADVALIELGRDHGQRDLADKILADLLKRDLRRVLGGDDDRVDARGAVVLVVLHSDLGLAVRTEIVERAVLAHLGQTARHFMRERDGQRHELARFVAGVAEHHALVSGAVGEIVALAALLALERLVDAHCDIGGLLVDGREHRAGLAVKAELRAVVADVAHDVAHDLRDVDVAARGDLAHDENKAGRGGALARDVAVGVLFENGVEHRVGDLIADLIGMAFGDAFGCEEIVCHGFLLM